MMMRTFAGVTLAALLSSPVFAQSTDTPPAFEIADVHTSPHRTFPFPDGGSLHGDRYAFHQATMLDLIAYAYGLDPSLVQGGPIWLETDRFDVIAKAPPKTSKETLKLMMKSLLAERFSLVTHTGSKPMPAWVLTVGKGKAKLKEGDETGKADCQYQEPPPNQPPGTVSNIVFVCHNTTMEAFAKDLHDWAGGYLTDPVVDSTGLKGAWDFDIKWTGKGQLQRAGTDGISIFDAVDKQLGLKLDLETAPRPVLLVNSVNQKPTPNAPGLEKILPTPPPAQFDVATIKPSKPDADFRGRINGDQVNVQGSTLKFLITFAWDLNPNDPEVLVGTPKWLDSDRFDILAKAVSDAPGGDGAEGPRIEIEDLRQMLKALLIERFKMQTHMEDRPVSAYTLIAVNPKLRKADPLSRTRCKEGPGPDGKDPRIATPILNRLLSCQNMTMAQIGDELQRVAAGYIYSPVLDGTGIKGSWDFTLSFSSIDQTRARAAGAGSAAGASAAGGGAAGGGAGGGGSSSDGSASDPSGALTLFDAVNRQLGLKLEKQRRPAPVLVIDHIEEKPTEN
ncbi:MAG TPA: TIGR03435 family protein [Edaphobacter sp.]|nr:TIGR03435 family protein [Edaphobacter sp.]